MYAIRSYYASRGGRYHKSEFVRNEMIDAFGGIVKAIQESGIVKRSGLLDDRRSTPYWATTREMTARSFEAYLISKLQDQNASNDYLANILPPKSWELVAPDEQIKSGYPYPTLDA